MLHKADPGLSRVSADTTHFAELLVCGKQKLLGHRHQEVACSQEGARQSEQDGRLPRWSGRQPWARAWVHVPQHLADCARAGGPAALCGGQATRWGPPSMGAAACLGQAGQLHADRECRFGILVAHKHLTGQKPLSVGVNVVGLAQKIAGLQPRQVRYASWCPQQVPREMRSDLDPFSPSVPPAIFRFLFVSRCYSEHDINILEFFHNFFHWKSVSYTHTRMYVKICSAKHHRWINK